ncbi:MAG: PIN domain-containing protein [Microcystis aeruginosa LG13-11]|jgi:predicted nucleic acid-binding protein|nr:PIN domain-containing protein [Microcystis aeruginosa LG13-11]
MIIADTGFWLALANRDDTHHSQAAFVIASINEPLITTWCVITETCYLLLTRLGNHAQLRFMDNILEGGIIVFELKNSPIKRMRELMTQYGDLPMDLADTSLVILAENLGQGRILTSDCQDFSIYRWNETRNFENLFLEYP